MMYTRTFLFVIIAIFLRETAGFIEVIDGVVRVLPSPMGVSSFLVPGYQPQIQISLRGGIDYFQAPLPPAVFSNMALIRALSECTMDMCLAIDTSSSLEERDSNGKTGFENEMEFSTNLVRRISTFGSDVSVRYATVRFGQRVDTWFDFTENQATDHIIWMLNSMQMLKGQTNIPDAMIECQNHLSRSGRDVNKVALVLTDGTTTAKLSKLTVAEAADSLKAHGIRSIAVGAGRINATELLTIAQGDPESVFVVENTASLNLLVDEIGITSCSEKNKTDNTTTTSSTTVTTTPTISTTTPYGPCKWTDWSPCDLPCGGGVQSRTMIDCCDKCLARVETRSCNPDLCPVSVDGGWSEWSAYGACTDSCGGGYQIRSRTCSNPSQVGPGKPCQGPANEIKKCNTQGCPVDGQWGDWCCTWSECSATCGGGRRTRNRECSNPAPSNGGAYCVGDSQQGESCNDDPCPIDGGWSGWSDWSKCNRGTCYKSRTRTCTDPAPQYGGQECPGHAAEFRACMSLCCFGMRNVNPWLPC